MKGDFMKKLLCLSLLLFLTGCGVAKKEEKEIEEADVTLDYAITTDNQIKWADIFNQEENRYVVYFYSEYCGHCKLVKQDILSYYLLDLEKIYFVDVVKEDAVFKANQGDIIGMKNIDDFKDIEDYVANSTYDMEKLKEKNLNKINDNKIKNKDKNKDKKITEEKNEIKIINDFFINNDGDIELSANNIKESKNKQKNSNNNITKHLGPLMEEDENNKTMSINNNKSIFNSVKDLWKFQKILLENDIIDIISK